MNSIKLTNLSEHQYVAKCPKCWCRMSSITIHCFSFTIQLFLDRYWLTFWESLWSFHQKLDRLNISGVPLPFILVLYASVQGFFRGLNMETLISRSWKFVFAFILHPTIVSPDFFLDFTIFLLLKISPGHTFLFPESKIA